MVQFGNNIDNDIGNNNDCNNDNDSDNHGDMNIHHNIDKNNISFHSILFQLIINSMIVKTCHKMSIFEFSIVGNFEFLLVFYLFFCLVWVGANTSKCFCFVC